MKYRELIVVHSLLEYLKIKKGVFFFNYNFCSGYQTNLPHLYNSADNNRHHGHSHTVRLLQRNKVSM